MEINQSFKMTNPSDCQGLTLTMKSPNTFFDKLMSQSVISFVKLSNRNSIA
jgi:hypothetical protein